MPCCVMFKISKHSNIEIISSNRIQNVKTNVDQRLDRRMDEKRGTHQVLDLEKNTHEDHESN